MYLELTRGCSFLDHSTAGVFHVVCACVCGYLSVFVTVGASLQDYHCITIVCIFLCGTSCVRVRWRTACFATCVDALEHTALLGQNNYDELTRTNCFCFLACEAVVFEYNWFFEPFLSLE